jgi:hypothetical protein
MKRRRFVQSIVAAPAASALFVEVAEAQKAPPPGNPGNPAPGVPQNPTRGNQPPGFAAQELPRLDVSVPDVAADTSPKFFTQTQFEALRHICELLYPALDNRPGAMEAHAPEFLDFLIAESPMERQELYRKGLDALNSESGKRYKKTFAATTVTEADAILAPLRDAWQYSPPASVLGQFLVAAKADVRTATVNSREYVAAVGRGGSRRGGGIGLYWYSLD